MINQIFLTILIIIKSSFALNFYPLPDTFTKTIRLSPTFGKSYFSQIDISGIRGSSEAIFDVFGIGLTWGAPFEGWEANITKLMAFCWKK